MPVPRDLMTATLRFGQMLRAAGLPLTVSEVMDAVRALNVIDLMDREEVYLALRAVLVARVEEIPVFDRAFDAFWKFHADEGQGLEGLVSVTPTLKQEDEAPAGAVAQDQASVALDAWEDGGDDEESRWKFGVSDRETLMEKDFSAFPAEDLARLLGSRC
jgi:uncharacterized protein with von Willebrand factor type A (vWA) domain